MTGRLVSRFCDLCGRRLDLHGPAPGELGLDRIGTVFRSCVSCGRYVGTACCWDREALACVDCLSTRKARLPDKSKAGQRREGPAARRALAQLSSAVLALQRFGSDRRLSGQLALPDWEDAWWKAGWLILKTESAGDVAVQRLQALSAATKTNATLVAELAALIDAYAKARSLVEARLAAAGQPLRQEARHGLQPLRGPRLAVVTGLFIAALTVTTVVAGASILGTSLRGTPAGGSAEPGQRAGGVLGTSQAQETPAPSAHVPALVAMLDFDLLRIGPLEGASSDIAAVIGHADVASFPSPFDRSIRFSGPGPNGFCLAKDHLGAGGVSVTVDLYAVQPISTGSLELVATAPDGFVTVASIPERVLRRLSAERWYRVSVDWMPGTREVIGASERGLGTLFVDSLDLAAGISSTDPHSLCLRAAGMPRQSQLLLDNLRVEQ